MFFAIDPLIPEIIRTQLNKLIATPTRPLHWFALVDRAFDHGLAPHLAVTNDQLLYRSADLADLAAVSPALIPLEADSGGQLARQLDGLTAHCSGRPMLSFVASAGKADTIIQAWAPLHFIKTRDGERYLLRFTDTRVLPILPRALAPSHWAALHRPLAYWVCPDRAGQLTMLPRPETQARQPTHLADETLASLLHATQADAIVAHWQSSEPDLLPEYRKAQFHATLQRTCAEHADLEFGELLNHCRAAVLAAT